MREVELSEGLVEQIVLMRTDAELNRVQLASYFQISERQVRRVIQEMALPPLPVGAKATNHPQNKTLQQIEREEEAKHDYPISDLGEWLDARGLTYREWGKRRGNYLVDFHSSKHARDFLNALGADGDDDPDSLQSQILREVKVETVVYNKAGEGSRDAVFSLFYTVKIPGNLLTSAVTS